MNTFFGHGFTAALVLATALTLLDGNFALAGLAYGFSLLSDYGCAALLPAFAAAAWIRSPGARARAFARIALGGLLPGLLWVAYHVTCFGGPLAIANKFQNPKFVDTAGEESNLWGVIRLLPRGRVVLELLFGSARGLLWTQPWVLGLLAWLACNFKKLAALPRPRAAVAVLTLGGFAGLFWMNAAFGGWHGGGAPGPRYLSQILPLFALLAAWFYDAFSPWARRAAWAGLAWSVGLLVVAYATFIVVPVAPLWRTYWDFLTVDPTYTPPLRIAAMVLVLAWGARGAAVIAEFRRG
jgi:hypothetical protein